MSASQVRFDAYTATTQALGVQDALSLLFCHGDTVQAGRGFHTFKERIAVRDRFGFEVGSILHGGSQGERVMVEIKGERTPSVVDRVRSEKIEHRCTRVDSCVDVERPGAFDELLSAVSQVKANHRLYGERRGDWEFPEKGRTQYLGANSSPIRARLYEKGKQPEHAHLQRFDLCRLEVQVRPQKDAKNDYSSLSAVEVWGASKWTRELAGLVLGELLDPHPPGTVRKDTQRDRALKWMAMQYGPHLVSLAADLGGWDMLGLTLGEMVKEERAKRASALRH